MRVPALLEIVVEIMVPVKLLRSVTELKYCVLKDQARCMAFHAVQEGISAGGVVSEHSGENGLDHGCFSKRRVSVDEYGRRSRCARLT